MCGIAGYIGKGDREILERMTNSMTRRGPDDVGFFVEKNVGLGHRRLSIIDLSPLGHQPMFSPDGNIAIVFNGEIYNWQTRREELQKKGYQFKSGSDTEVIIYLYQEYGADCFKKLNGMFAIGLYDKAEQQLLLARDRLGKKPLHWTLAGDTLIFASELKGLMAHPLFKKEIDPASLDKYLAYDYIPTPHTIFQGVHKLEPGHYLAYREGAITKNKFWDIAFGVDPEVNRLSEDDLLMTMERQLEQAVSSRLVADVPLGIFLSGGLDSSTIAYYAQKNSQEKIKTFSIGFAEKSFDESAYARQVAKFLGTDHYEQQLSAKDSLDLIPQIGAVLDEPMADYSIIPTYLLSKFTRQHVTVALGGDGGDELFFGYPTLMAERVMQMLQHLPHQTKEIFYRLQRYLPVSHNHFNRRFQLEQFLQGIDSPARYRHHAWMGTFMATDREKMFAPEVWRELKNQNVYEDIDQYLSNEHVSNESRWHQLVCLYLRTYLMDQVLVKVDRASMANSLEVRAPFLDYEFVDFVNSIDYTRKIKGFTTKHLLKSLMADKLPMNIVYRKKQGFGVPLGTWFARELKSFVADTLSPERIQAHGLFDPAYIQQILAEHNTLQRDQRKKIWSLVVFQLWFERWTR